MRRVRSIDMQPIPGDALLRRETFRLAAVRVHIETRKVRRRYVDPDAVPRLEQITGREWLDDDLANFACAHELGLLPGFAIAAAKNAVGQIHSKALRIVCAGRMYIDQLGREVGIG